MSKVRSLKIFAGKGGWENFINCIRKKRAGFPFDLLVPCAHLISKRQSGRENAKGGSCRPAFLRHFHGGNSPAHIHQLSGWRHQRN